MLFCSPLSIANIVFFIQFINNFWFVFWIFEFDFWFVGRIVLIFHVFFSLTQLAALCYFLEMDNCKLSTISLYSHLLFAKAFRFFFKYHLIRDHFHTLDFFFQSKSIVYFTSQAWTTIFWLRKRAEILLVWLHHVCRFAVVIFFFF